MKKFKFIPLSCALLALMSCSDNNTANVDDTINIDPVTPTAKSAEYYAGGLLGTTSSQDAYAYQQPTPAVNEQGFGSAFQVGEALFERDFNTNTDGAFAGLGPLYVRQGCLYCHPAYGHGKRQDRYKASDMGNGYLLVIYDKQTNAYIYSVAGMPQTGSVEPFKPQINEDSITIKWEKYTDDWGNKFDDGETYDLIYPEVTIPANAYYSPVTVMRNGEKVVIPDDQVASEIGVRLESTIGIYGTGLTDAIPDDSITKEWVKQSTYFNSVGKTDALNPAMWNQSTNTWNSYYSNSLQGDGTKYVRRYTYALSRGPILDLSLIHI